MYTRRIHSAVFIGLLFWTLASFSYARAQSHSQETVNAISDQRFQQLEVASNKNAMDISKLTNELTALRSSVDLFTGIGVGFGACLTVLQSLILLVTYRNGKKG